METSLKNIKVAPLSPKDKEELLKNIFSSISETGVLDQNNLQSFLEQLQGICKTYIDKYEQAWGEMQKLFVKEKVEQDLKLASTDSQRMKVYNDLGKLFATDVTAVENFIRVLEEGFLILEHIRYQLTTQKVETEFTLVSSSNINPKIYRVPKSHVEYELVLSTYGASGENFVSLAYSVPVTKAINAIEEDLEKRKQAILIRQNEDNRNDIYAKIMKVKPKYLEWKAEQYKIKNPDKPPPTYYPRFDSKDAEIFNLLYQKNYDLSRFYSTTYADLRASMGGAGGNGGPKTTALQGGDVGLIQDKLIKAGTDQVNFARQTLVLKHFKELYEVLVTLKQRRNTKAVKEKMLDLFTATNKDAISDSISKAYNKTAQDAINNLFKGFKIK